MVQNAFAWLRALTPDVLAAARRMLLTMYPDFWENTEELQNTFVGARARRMTLASFFGLLILNGAEVPASAWGDAASKALESSVLSDRPPNTPPPPPAIVPLNNARSSLTSHPAGNSTTNNNIPATTTITSTAPQQDFTPLVPHWSRTENEQFTLPPRPKYLPSYTAKLLDPSTGFQSRHVAQVRPWESYFAIFDPDGTGYTDRFLLLAPMLFVSSSQFLTEPLALRHRSQNCGFTRTLVCLLAQLLKRRSEVIEQRVRSGQASNDTMAIRLGELHVLRDLLRNEFTWEAKLCNEQQEPVVAPEKGPSMVSQTVKRLYTLSPNRSARPQAGGDASVPSLPQLHTSSTVSARGGGEGGVSKQQPVESAQQIAHHAWWELRKSAKKDEKIATVLVQLFDRRIEGWIAQRELPTARTVSTELMEVYRLAQLSVEMQINK